MPAPPPNSTLLIVGASVRAAAQSALRAGFTPVCADAFADADLRACARVLPVIDFPRRLPEALEALPPSPWIYTGGLENHPGLLARLEQDRPLWGNGPDVLRRVRNPRLVAQSLAAAGLPVLEVRSSREPPSADGSWMLKPLCGSAGRGVVRWDSLARTASTRREPHYFQRRVEGAAFSALFLGAGKGRDPQFIGVSRQLIGLSWANAPTSSAWCGNLAPAAVAPEVETTIRASGRTLAAEFSLIGLFGCDFLVADGVPWLTEVNPRYTGSTELFEIHQRCAWLAEHSRVCLHTADGSVRSRSNHQTRTEIQADQPPATIVPKRAGVLGKLVVYASRDAVFARETSDPTPADLWRIPVVADVPMVGQPVPAGTPICSVFAMGADDEDCWKLLRARVEEVENWLR